METTNTNQMNKTTKTKSKTGWWNPEQYSTRTKFHYVGEDGRTLCGKWGYIGFGELEEGNDIHSKNCCKCQKRKLDMNDNQPIK